MLSSQSVKIWLIELDYSLRDSYIREKLFLLCFTFVKRSQGQHMT